MTYETRLLFMFYVYVNYILHKASIFVHAHVD